MHQMIDAAGLTTLLAYRCDKLACMTGNCFAVVAYRLQFKHQCRDTFSFVTSISLTNVLPQSIDHHIFLKLAGRDGLV